MPKMSHTELLYSTRVSVRTNRGPGSGLSESTQKIFSSIQRRNCSRYAKLGASLSAAASRGSEEEDPRYAKDPSR